MAYLPVSNYKADDDTLLL